MKILISGGGTGGGVYPALAVAAALTTKHPDVELLWVGSPNGPERDLVARCGIAYECVRGGPIAGVGLRVLSSMFKLGYGTSQALVLVRRFKPDALLMTGGWVTIPATLACVVRGVPIVIQVPDIEPGSTIKVLSRLAARVAVIAPEAARYYRPGQAVETGYAIRPELLEAAGYNALGEPVEQYSDTQAVAQERFGLLKDVPTLLVFGGSRGARSINRALVGRLTDLLAGCQIIHISGRLDWEWVESEATSLPPDIAGRYHAFDYLYAADMALALSTADLVVSRAGASVLGEFPLFGLPAILVPYPHAWRYQKTNADYLVARGAAVRLDDDRLLDELVPLVQRLLTDTAERERMVDAARALMRPDAAAHVAAVVSQAVETMSRESRGTP